MIIYDIFQYVLVIVIGMIIGYQLMLSLIAYMTKHELTAKQSAFNNSFLIIVYVNGEEEGISKTLYSLYGLIYPSNLYEIIIITGKDTEITAEIGRKFGISIYRDNYSYQKWNIDVINKKFEEIGIDDQKYDAVVVIKPGGLVSGNLLEVMNLYLEGGSDILQSSNVQIEKTKSWKVKINHAMELLYNHINMLGRKKLGLAAHLTGNGVCFRTQILKNNVLELYEIANNIGSDISLISKGIQINYVPEVIVWSQSNNTEVERYREEKKQWLQRFQARINYIKNFFSYLYKIKNRPLQEFDTLISQITPSYIVLLLITVGMTILNGLLWGLAIISSVFFWLWLSLVCMAIIYLIIGIFTDRAIFLALSADPQKLEKIESEKI